jgi:hypothetical protein
VRHDALAFAVPFIEASLKRSNPSGNTLEEVLGEIQAGRARLWMGHNSAAITQHVATERVWHASGDGQDLMAIFQRAVPILRQVGVERLTVEDTRKGWTKRLRPYGFEPFTGLGLDL